MAKGNSLGTRRRDKDKEIRISMREDKGGRRHEGDFRQFFRRGKNPYARQHIWGIREKEKGQGEGRRIRDKAK